MAAAGDIETRALVIRGWREPGEVMRLSMQRVNPLSADEPRYLEVTGLKTDEAGFAALGREVLGLLFVD